jgi:hypothetical protein
MFKAADAGLYNYSVTAVNRYGESLPFSVVSSVAHEAGKAAVLTITDGGYGSGAAAATCYKIYRSAVGGAGDRQLLTTVKRDAATTAFTDYNWFLPGTSMAWMSEEDDAEHHSFRQLAPLMRIPLATVAASMRWMQLLYGTPLLYKPRQNVVFVNVKDS